MATYRTQLTAQVPTDERPAFVQLQDVKPFTLHTLHYIRHNSLTEREVLVKTAVLATIPHVLDGFMATSPNALAELLDSSNEGEFDFTLGNPPRQRPHMGWYEMQHRAYHTNECLRLANIAIALTDDELASVGEFIRQTMKDILTGRTL